MFSKINASEYHILKVLWSHNNEMQAARIADILSKEIGWSKSTTYTIIRRCKKKGLITYEKTPDSSISKCKVLIQKTNVQKFELDSLIQLLFNNKNADFIRYYNEYIKKADDKGIITDNDLDEKNDYE